MKKKITLPSGGTCVVRAATGQDYYLAGADSFPDVFVATSEANAETRAKSMPLEQREALIQVTQRVLAGCVSPITFKDGKRRRLVVKDIDLVNDASEIHIAEIEPDDFNAIQEAFNSMAKEVADKARPFPAESPDDAQPGRGGETLRQDTKPDADTAG